MSLSVYFMSDSNLSFLFCTRYVFDGKPPVMKSGEVCDFISHTILVLLSRTYSLLNEQREEPRHSKALPRQRSKVCVYSELFLLCGLLLGDTEGVEKFQKRLVRVHTCIK